MFNLFFLKLRYFDNGLNNRRTFTDESMKINWFKSEKYFFTDESVKRQITDSTSENLTDSDLESIASYQILKNYVILINHGSFFQEKDSLQLNRFQFSKMNKLLPNSAISS